MSRSARRRSGEGRMFFANPRLRRFARVKAHATKGGPIARYRRLPARKGARRR